MSVEVSNLPLNKIPNEPTLRDFANLVKKELALALYCHQIGTVQSFDASVQTAKVTINYKKTYYNLDPVTGLYTPVLVDYPLLVDCPVICLGGGTSSLTFPIKQGDECLVLFNDRDMDNWLQGGSGSAVATNRLHSFSDAIILVGIRSLAHVIQSYDTVRAVLQQGSTLVGVGPSHVKIANGTTTLNTLLQSLINQIKAITTLNSDSTTGVVSAASQAALAVVATQISGLLE